MLRVSALAFTIFVVTNFYAAFSIVHRVENEGNKSKILPRFPEIQNAANCLIRVMNKHFVPRSRLLTFLTFDETLELASLLQDRVLKVANQELYWTVAVINGLYAVEDHEEAGNATETEEDVEGEVEEVDANYARVMTQKTKFCVVIVDTFDVFLFNLHRFVQLDHYDSTVAFLVINLSEGLRIPSDL